MRVKYIEKFPGFYEVQYKGENVCLLCGSHSDFGFIDFVAIKDKRLQSYLIFNLSWERFLSLGEAKFALEELLKRFKRNEGAILPNFVTLDSRSVCHYKNEEICLLVRTERKKWIFTNFRRWNGEVASVLSLYHQLKEEFDTKEEAMKKLEACLTSYESHPF